MDCRESEYLRNAWYVAGWSREFTRNLSAKTILGERIVFYRTENGELAALEDACPHRKLPLSKGRLKGSNIECGYHGLTFSPEGSCVAAPTQPGSIPKRASVRSYPACDRYRLSWIWLGDPEKADTDRIFPIENYGDPAWGATDGGSIEIDCNYLWVADNLLDPSHVAWVHTTTFAGAGTDSGPLNVRKTGRGVIVDRWIYQAPPSPYYAGLVKFDGLCDRLQHYEMCFPAIALNKSVYTPAGTGGPGKPPTDKTYINISYNFLTPSDAGRTLYFWFQHRNTDPNDRSVSERMNEGLLAAFEEDREVLELVHRGMEEKTTPNIDLGLDAGAKLFRRALQTEIRLENEAGSQ